MAGIWNSPEPVTVRRMSPSTVDWVPLPEVEPLRESKSYSNPGYTEYVPPKRYTSYSSPVLTSKHPANIQPSTPSNLTIMSLGTSSTTQPRLGMSSEVTPGTTTSTNRVSNPTSHLDPAHLDELWKKFLETVVIPDNQNSGCGCNCHLKNPPIDPRSTGNPPVYDFSPPGKENAFTNYIPKNEFIRHNASHPKTRSKTSIPVDTSSHTTDTTGQFSTSSYHSHSHSNPHSYVSKETQTSTIPNTFIPSYIPTSDATNKTTPTCMESSTLEKLTLQEACYLMKKRFIINSKKRQETINQRMAQRRRHKELLPWQPMAPPTVMKPSIPPIG